MRWSLQTQDDFYGWALHAEPAQLTQALQEVPAEDWPAVEAHLRRKFSETIGSPQKQGEEPIRERTPGTFVYSPEFMASIEKHEARKLVVSKLAAARR